MKLSLYSLFISLTPKFFVGVATGVLLNNTARASVGFSFLSRFLSSRAPAPHPTVKDYDSDLVTNDSISETSEATILAHVTDSEQAVETVDAAVQTYPNVFEVNERDTDTQTLQDVDPVPAYSLDSQINSEPASASVDTSTYTPSEMVLKYHPDGHDTFTIVFNDPETFQEVASVFAGDVINDLPEVPLLSRTYVHAGTDAQVEPVTLSAGVNTEEPVTLSTGVNTEDPALRLDASVATDTPLATVPVYKDASVGPDMLLNTPSPNLLPLKAELTDEDFLQGLEVKTGDTNGDLIDLVEPDTVAEPAPLLYTPAPELKPLEIDIEDDFFANLDAITEQADLTALLEQDSLIDFAVAASTLI